MKKFITIILLMITLPNLAVGQNMSKTQPQNQTKKELVSTREMDRINWMEFKEVVPSKIQTVLLPTGTLEPHGVINNGADNTAPMAIAQTIAQRVNGMIAPTLPYGITGSMQAYPGAFQ
ncbi:MAG: creatininase family protein, partial [Acidobacteriota bacterium]